MIPYSNRRQFLQQTACGFGSLAWSALATQQAFADLGTHGTAHHAPRAKRVIFLFMQGGVSQVDSFDYKPALSTHDGKQMPFDDARTVANTGTRGTNQRVMQSLWKFSQYGECGQWASELFPSVAEHVDDLCFMHGLHTEGVAHGPATLFLHCGSTNFVRPSMGSWITYGLGTENENLPGFVSISPSSGNGGARNYGPAFLPASYQGTALGSAGRPASEATFRNLTPAAGQLDQQQQQLELLQAFNAEQQQRFTHDSELDAAIQSYELAWGMQQHAPDVCDLSQESAATMELYGIGEEPTDNYGRQCLLARRLAESGVRYIQVTYGDNTANPAWDQHSDLPKHADHARAVDKPIAGLLADLKQRGLLEDTIVWCGSEFGRTPYAQQNGTGRDHNPGGFTVWLAGGGFKPGIAHGATDELGHKAVAGKVHMHDMHATILHQLGLDHKKLTYSYSGRNFRLTDVHGRVVEQVLG